MPLFAPATALADSQAFMVPTTTASTMLTAPKATRTGLPPVGVTS